MTTNVELAKRFAAACEGHIRAAIAEYQAEGEIPPILPEEITDLLGELSRDAWHCREAETDIAAVTSATSAAEKARQVLVALVALAGPSSPPPSWLGTAEEWAAGELRVANQATRAQFRWLLRGGGPNPLGTITRRDWTLEEATHAAP